MGNVAVGKVDVHALCALRLAHLVRLTVERLVDDRTADSDVINAKPFSLEDLEQFLDELHATI